MPYFYSPGKNTRFPVKDLQEMAIFLQTSSVPTVLYRFEEILYICTENRSYCTGAVPVQNQRFSVTESQENALFEQPCAKSTFFCDRITRNPRI